MFDFGMIVDVLLAVDQIETVERALRAFAVKHHMNIVAHQRAAQGDCVRGQMGDARANSTSSWPI